MEDHVGYAVALLVGDDIKKEIVEEEVIFTETVNMDDAEIQENEHEDDKETTIDSGMDSTRLQCHICYKVMGHRSSLYKHLKYIHKIEPAHRLPITCREKDCFQSFTFIDPFRRHLAEQHGFNIIVEKYIFQNMSEFFAWKKITEQQENLRFIVSTGPRNSKGGKTHYYRCQKNGTYKPEIRKRLQADDRESVYNASRTHCISSMFVFEEPECVSVEFCRTHYGHEVDALEKNSEEHQEVHLLEGDSMETESNLVYESVDSYAKLNSYLTKKDKKALATILSKNRSLLEESEDLFYENEQDMMLKIPNDMLKRILEDGKKLGDDEESDNEETVISAIAEDLSSEDVTVSKIISDLVEDEEDEEKVNVNESGKDSAILKSLGNGIFLDPTSNKKLKLDSLKRKNRSKGNIQFVNSPSQHEPRTKDRDKNTQMLLKEYLNEYNEKVYILEPIENEETVVQKRETILSQLQAILMMVNDEEDIEVLDEIKRDLSKYAVPQ